MKYESIHNECHQTGLLVGVRVNTRPMLVGEAKSLLSNEIDYTKKTYLMDDGPCGYAWVTIRPGNSKLANAYKKLGLAKSAWNGGVEYWVSEFGQSVDRKAAYAEAYAAKLRQLTGHETIYSGSRLD
jgi:hypothetical protein